MALHESAIDESVLESLRVLQKQGQQDFPSKIVSLYLDTAPSVLKEIESSASAGDASLLRIASHRLNAASTAVGALRLVAFLPRARSDDPGRTAAARYS